MRPTVSKLFSCSGLVLAVILSACSSGGGVGDAVDAQQTTSPAPATGAVETPTPEGAGETEPEATDKETAPDDADGPTTIGGEETGLTLEIPDEWVDLPMDPDVVSEGLDSLDLTDDQAVFIESSISALGSLDGAVMAVDTSTLGSSLATNVNAYCVPNDGSVGDGNLEAAVELGLEMIAEGIEVESATVDGHRAARAKYSLDMGGARGAGVQYMFLADDDICWATFTGADEGQIDLFDDIAATIDVL